MKKIFLILLVNLLLTGCNQDDAPPKLVIFISVDQLNEDMFYHYNDLFQSGYKWMVDNGVWFTNMHHEHWYNATGPGHFVLSSGQHPNKGRIIGNYYYDRSLKRKVYCIEDTLAHLVGTEKKGLSYRQIPTTTLGDWLKQKYQNSKIFSVAGKDRAAILLAGKNPDLAVWYDWGGSFVTSDYYTNVYPEWLIKFNSESDLAKYRDSLWVRELETQVYEKYTRIDDFYGEIDTYNSKEYSPVFPIGYDSDLTDEQVLDRLGNGPWLDIETLRLAEVILLEEELGKDSSPDILFIGLSGTDVIGHNYGPFSQEAMDNQLKLDKYLQEFINIVEKEIDLKDVLFVLTSDHGVLPLAEYLSEYKGIPAGRIDRKLYYAARESALQEIELKYGNGLVIKDFDSFYYDLDELKAKDIAKAEIDSILKKYLGKIEGIGFAISKDEILNGDPNDLSMSRLRNFTHAYLSPDFIVIPKKYWTFRYPLGATHGTPYSYDANVPFILTQKGRTIGYIEKQKYATVDIAPTIAKILGLEPPFSIDGKPVF